MDIVEWFHVGGDLFRPRFVSTKYAQTQQIKTRRRNPLSGAAFFGRKKYEVAREAHTISTDIKSIPRGLRELIYRNIYGLRA